jgi:hypothetical protein
VAEVLTQAGHPHSLVLAEASRVVDGQPAPAPAPTAPAGAAPAQSLSTDDPQQLMQQLNGALAQSPAPQTAIPTSTSPPARFGSGNLRLEETGLTALGEMARGATPPSNDDGFLFVCQINGAVRAPGVSSEQVKAYEKEPLVPDMLILKYYRLGGLSLY